MCAYSFLKKRPYFSLYIVSKNNKSRRGGWGITNDVGEGYRFISIGIAMIACTVEIYRASTNESCGISAFSGPRMNVASVAASAMCHPVFFLYKASRSRRGLRTVHVVLPFASMAEWLRRGTPWPR